MVDKNNKANLNYYASNKSRKAGRSFLGAETLGLADAYDSVIVLSMT